MSEVLAPGTVDPLHYAGQIRRWQSPPFTPSHEIVNLDSTTINRRVALLEYLWQAAVFGNDET